MYAGKIALLVLIISGLAGCKSSVEGSREPVRKDPQVPTDKDKINKKRKSSPVTFIDDYKQPPLVHLESSPEDSEGNSLELLVVGKNATSYKYAFVSEKATTGNDLLVTVLENKEFAYNLIKDSGEKLFSILLGDPNIVQKIQRMGLRILSNQNIMTSIMQTDGIDIPTLTKTISSLLADANKLQVTTDSAEKVALKKKIFDTLEELGENKKLMSAILTAMAHEGDFLAELLREEDLVKDILNNEELIAEVMKHEDGKILAEAIDIPIALTYMQDSISEFASDEGFMLALLQPELSSDIDAVLTDSASLLAELKKSKQDQKKIKTLKDRIHKNLLSLGKNEELASKIFAVLMTDVALVSPLERPCSGVNYSNTIPLSQLLIIDDVGGAGKKTICLKGVADDGSVQQEPTIYTWKKDDS